MAETGFGQIVKNTFEDRAMGQKLANAAKGRADGGLREFLGFAENIPFVKQMAGQMANQPQRIAKSDAGKAINDFFTGGDGWGGNPSGINKGLFGGDGLGGELGLLEKFGQVAGLLAGVAGQGQGIAKDLAPAIGASIGSDAGAVDTADIVLPELATGANFSGDISDSTNNDSASAAAMGEEEEQDRDEGTPEEKER
jgi:hypothetical protein